MKSNKPKCKLPEFCASSHLIGMTVVTLRKAGLEEEKTEFVSILKDNTANIDYFTAFQIASNYVEFYD